MNVGGETKADDSKQYDAAFEKNSSQETTVVGSFGWARRPELLEARSLAFVRENSIFGGS